MTACICNYAHVPKLTGCHYEFTDKDTYTIHNPCSDSERTPAIDTNEFNLSGDIFQLRFNYGAPPPTPALPVDEGVLPSPATPAPPVGRCRPISTLNKRD